jgi:hypothetical protein
MRVLKKVTNGTTMSRSKTCGDRSVAALVPNGAAHGYTMSDMGAFNPAACEQHFETLSS